VGLAVGFHVGFSVGLHVVGRSVGYLEGRSVGLGEGDFVGFVGAGVCVGDVVEGDIVGAIDPFVGEVEFGVVVGDGLIELDWPALGAAECLLVGFLVGTFVDCTATSSNKQATRTRCRRMARID